MTVYHQQILMRNLVKSKYNKVTSMALLDFELDAWRCQGLTCASMNFARVFTVLPQVPRFGLIKTLRVACKSTRSISLDLSYRCREASCRVTFASRVHAQTSSLTNWGLPTLVGSANQVKARVGAPFSTELTVNMAPSPFQTHIRHNNI